MTEFKDKAVVVTGGAQGIGRCIADEFQKAGAHVCVIDNQAGNHFVGELPTIHSAQSTRATAERTSIQRPYCAKKPLR